MLRSGLIRQSGKAGTECDTKDTMKDVLKELFEHPDFHSMLADCIDKVISRKLQKLQEEQERQEAKIFDLEQEER